MSRSVLQFIEAFREGGSEGQAVQLARLLHESGRFRVHVACLNGGGVLRHEIDRLGIGPVPEFPLTSFYDHNAWVQLRRFSRYLRCAGIDLVHTHDFYTNIFGMVGAAVAGVPARVASRRETTGTRTPTQKLAERSAYRLSQAIIANAEAVRRELVAEGTRPSKVVTVYNGVDLERVAPGVDTPHAQAIRMLGLPRDDARPLVTLVANLRLTVKDHPTFLRAARRVKYSVPEVAFVVAGEGELLESTRALSRDMGLEGHVFFTGRCDAIAELLAASAVCVLSSRAEGFSNAILEYMAAGRPVVATDVGGARESVVDGETGYLVAAGDDEAMAARIVSLLRDPERSRSMGEKGRLVVRSKFSCEAQLAKVESLYERLLSRGARVSRVVEGLSQRAE